MATDDVSERPPRRQALILGAAAVAAAAAGAGWAWWRLRLDEPDAGVDVWSLRFPQPGGGELALSSLRGQVLVLNFWATWCPPCIEELPDLDRLHREEAGRGVRVVGLAVDKLEPVQQFLARRPLGFGIGLAGFAGTELSRQLGNTAGGLPFTAVFGRDGRLQHRKLGQTRLAELQGWVRQL